LNNGYKLLGGKDEYKKNISGDEGHVIKEYIKYEETLAGNAELIPDNWMDSCDIKIIRWAHLLLPTEQIAQCSWKETFTEDSDERCAWCVKLYINNVHEFAEVLFYFTVSINQESRDVALVQMYSHPDNHLFEESNWTVWSITKLGPEALHVVHVQSIISVVAIISHNHHVEARDIRFFVWEQIGLVLSAMPEKG
ncbi:hypothetical protein BDQ12DRAFT_619574, partial [Crucibulum laeve]